MEPKTPESIANATETTNAVAEAPSPATTTAATKTLPEEFGGSGKAEPTRFGDWEINGKCVDF